MSAEVTTGQLDTTVLWKANENFLLRNIGGDSVLVLIGKAPSPRLENCMISMNETSAFLWELFEKAPVTEQQAVEAARAEFSAPDGVIEQHIRVFIKTYAEIGLLLKEE